MKVAILLQSFLQDIWNWVNHYDQALFLQINTVWTNPTLDSVYPWYREGSTWYPLYLFLIVFSLLNFKQKASSWILFVVATLVLTDQLSSSSINLF